MPTFAWVALSMLIAGLGGALATRGSMSLMYRGLEPQPTEVLRSLTALGAVFAGLCGGIASVGRASLRGRNDLLAGLVTLLLGVAGAGFMNLGFLFSPFLLIVAPLQGLAAILGGFAAVGALWGMLWLAGMRDGMTPTTVDVGATKIEPPDAAGSR